MNKKAKRRLMVVGGIVIIAILVVAAMASSGGAASSLSIDEVLTGGYEGRKVQVSGSVVADSLTSEGSTAVFRIAPEGDDSPESELEVSYDGALPATFGTGVVAICTGTVEGRTLLATEMVAKCPSKYESAEGALTVKGLLDQADTMMFEQTKVCGYVQGPVNDAQSDVRFTIESQGATLDIVYDGGLDEQIAEGTAVVVAGHLDSDGNFIATEQPSIDSSIKA